MKISHSMHIDKVLQFKKDKELTDRIDLKADPVAVKSEDENQEIANENGLGAIEKELPVPEDITYKCHRCGEESTNEISHINHIEIHEYLK